MRSVVRTFVVVALAAQAASSLAAGVVGVWKGKVTVDVSKAPKAPNAQAQKQMDEGLAMVRKMELLLNLKPNKTYVADAKRVPNQPGPKKSEGTWKQEGTTLWLTAVKDDGKPATNKKPQKFLILDGGRKLSLAEATMPAWIKVTFTR